MITFSPAVRIVVFAGLAIALVLYGIDYNSRLDRKIAEDAAKNVQSAQDASAAREQAMEKLKKEDIKVGTGPEAKPGDTISLHYVGTFDNGSEFDSSRKRGAPLEFKLGAGGVIVGWDLGVQGMKTGGIRKLTIPPELGYGARGSSEGTIPPNATLHFEVEVLAITPGA